MGVDGESRTHNRVRRESVLPLRLVESWQKHIAQLTGDDQDTLAPFFHKLFLLPATPKSIHLTQHARNVSRYFIQDNRLYWLRFTNGLFSGLPVKLNKYNNQIGKKTLL